MFAYILITVKSGSEKDFLKSISEFDEVTEANLVIGENDIVIKVNVKDLLKDLNSAYADEWIAYFYYNWAADFIEGPSYPAVASAIDDIAKEELEHMSELADRIFELGGEPERDLEDLQK
ncbi:MAG: ferritin-like domain-containing protein, partial [Candidatus Bathyarchaeota archaeon]